MGNDVTVPSSRQPIPPARGNESIDFIHREERDAIHEHKEVGILRCTATFLRQIDFSAAVLRTRLGRSLAAKQPGGIIAFDAQLESPLLLKATWLVDTQQWTEAVNALKLAVQHGLCTLPVTISLEDLQRHTTEQAYLAEPRVLALWKTVGRHVNFGGNYGRFELFDQPGGGVRAINDEPGFELDINPPLPATHPYHPHTITDNPPVRSSIHLQGGSWTAGGVMATYASMSAFIVRIIMERPLANLGKTAFVHVDRYDHGGVLDGLLNRSPHQPPGGCRTIVALRWDDMNPPAEVRFLLLTSFDMPFVAYVDLASRADMKTGNKAIRGPPVLVRGLLSNTIADMALNQEEEEEDYEEDGADDDGDDDGDSDEDMDSNGEDDGQQEQEDE
ncbi:unnamed protein product [Vitrella brassicaformis CCMP3155]|uniref:Uncharacterized protein n=1 Tax=Vitrella brassicaformis (strain CCMP3155) TaxID=1169540 RepID=A0A0G4ESL2_VITBC|nr:unnamed protein product [Vitrella brassicaformis CCMP3155]|eukprot:CEM01622.1 unnamed protein product [Vitrella brassicaformis CCMP3155]